MQQQRVWGHYTVIEEGDKFKIKELVIEPGKAISFQRHFKRNEFWLVKSGCGKVRNGADVYSVYKGSAVLVPIGRWHKIENTSETEPLVIHEVQFGPMCIEEDIERRDLPNANT